MVIRWLILALALVAFTGPSLAGDKDYPGDDGGNVIYAVGIGGALTADFAFPYVRVATPDGHPISDWKGKIEPRLGAPFSLKVKNPDFSGFERGHVIVRRLPPGKYEIKGFVFGGQSPGGGGHVWTSKTPIVQSFEIRRGEATYIGSFSRAIAHPSLNIVPGGGTYFIIANRASRDLAVARQRLPANMKIAIEVTDVRQFGTPVLQADIPATALTNR